MTAIQREHVRALFREQRSRPYLIEVETGRNLTYGQVSDLGLRFASLLRERGVRRGDTVCFLSDNCLELALLFFATWHHGAVIVPINPQLAAVHIREIIDNAAPSLVIGNPKFLRHYRETTPLAQAGRVIEFVPRIENLREETPLVAALDLEHLAGDCEPAAQALHIGDDDEVFMRVYTSGSTAAPKGIDITVGGLIANERTFCEAMGIGADHRFYNILPMSYLGGVHNLLLLPLSVGASVVIDAPLGPSNVFGFWDTVREYEINTLWFTSAMLSMLMSLRDDDDMSWVAGQIRLGLVGMAPLTPETKKRFEARFGFTLFENYALSETAFISTNRPGAPYVENSKGQVLAGVEVVIVDEARRPLPPGETGEVLVRTPHLMKRYINASQADQDNILPGAFLTGDLGRFDGDALFIVGRKKDLIIRGGLNIAPAMVEAALEALPEVAEAAVVGIPHTVYGEEVAAAVTLVAGTPADFDPKSIARACDEKLAVFQRPKIIKILDELPRGVTGKIDKKAVRALFE